MATLTPTFPAPYPTNRRSIRFYATGTATANFDDRKYAFSIPGTSPAEQGWSNGIIVRATVADLEISFDGTNVHGKVPSGSSYFYWNRYEGGIAVRGLASEFTIEAW